MLEFSAADGFVDVSKSLGEMVTYVANEPSVGLYYIQQHTRDTSPNLSSLQKTIKESSRQVSLRTNDLNDSISTITSVKEYGLPIAHKMIQDIEKSLAITSRKQGMNSSFGSERSSSWIPTRWSLGSSDVYGDGNHQMNHYSLVSLKLAKQKAQNLKWPQLNSKKLKEDLSSHSDPWTMDPASGTDLDGETDELPLSSQAGDEIEENGRNDRKMEEHHVLSGQDSFNEFKADREVRLEEWLKDSGHCDMIGTEVYGARRI